MVDRLEKAVSAPIVIFNEERFRLGSPHNMAIQFEVEGKFPIRDQYPCLDYDMVKAIYDPDGRELWKNWDHPHQTPLANASSGLQVAMANNVHYVGLLNRVHRFSVDQAAVHTNRTKSSLSAFWDRVPLELINAIYSEQGELIYKNKPK